MILDMLYWIGAGIAEERLGVGTLDFLILIYEGWVWISLLFY